MATAGAHIKTSFNDKLYLGIVFSLLGLFLIIVLYPLIYVISASFSSPEALISRRVYLFPVDATLQGYRAVFETARVWTGYKNSVINSVVSCVLTVSLTMLGGYALSRREFPAKTFFTIFFMITMFFGGGTLPSYLLIKDLRLIDTIWALVLPGAYSVWMGIIAKTFVQSTVPEELYEAVTIDGGDYFTHFFRIVLPLSTPIIAVIVLNCATGQWNSYFAPMIYIISPRKYPLQLILQSILLQNQVDVTSMSASDVVGTMEKQYLSELLKYSLIIISSLPLLILYPFLQKYFVQGIMIGSVKG